MRRYRKLPYVPEYKVLAKEGIEHQIGFSTKVDETYAKTFQETLAMLTKAAEDLSNSTVAQSRKRRSK